MAGIGDSWGTREELLHPRDAKGRFRSKWKMSPAVLAAVERALGGFQPRTFQSDSQAAQFLFNEASAKKPGRFGGGDGFARLQADYNAADEDLRDGIVDEPSTKKFIQMMDEAAIELPDSLILSRVVGPDAFGLPPERIHEIEEMTGNVIADRGYGAANIGTPLAGGQGMITMIEATPKGTKVVIPGRNRNDRAVFHDRDQEFTVTKVKKDGRGGYNMYVVATPKTPGNTPPMEGVGPQGEGRSHDREGAVRRLQEMNDKRLTGEQPADQIAGQPAADTPGVAPAVDDETSRATRRAQILGRPAGSNATPAAQQGVEVPPAPTAPPVPEAPVANVPEAPSAVTPPPGATSVVTGQPVTSFRDAVGGANLEAPSAGPRRREWNSAYQGVVSGKQQPTDMLRELESDIANNKLQQNTETGRGDSVLAKDIEDQEKLADLIRSHFNLGEPKQRQARQEVRQELQQKAAKTAQKAMLRKPGGTEKAAPGKKTAVEAARPGPLAKVAAPRKDTPAERAKALVEAPGRDQTDDELNAAQRERWSDLAGSEPAVMKKNDTAGNILLDEVADLLRNGRITRPKASERLRDQAREDEGPEADYLRKVADAIDADTSKPAKKVPVKKAAKAAPDLAEATKKLAGRTDKNILTGLNGLSVGELRALADDWDVQTRGDDKKLKLKAALAKELAAKWKSSPDLKTKTGAPETPVPAKKVAKAATKAAAPATPTVGTLKTDRQLRAERRREEAAKPETPAQKQSRLDVQKLAGDLDERNAREQAAWDKSAADTRAGWDEVIGAPPADLDPLLSTGLTILAGDLASKKISKREAARRLEASGIAHPNDPYGDYLRKLVTHLRTPAPRKSQSKAAVLERLADEPEVPTVIKKAAVKAAKAAEAPAAPEKKTVNASRLRTGERIWVRQDTDGNWGPTRVKGGSVPIEVTDIKQESTGGHQRMYLVTGRDANGNQIGPARAFGQNVFMRDQPAPAKALDAIAPKKAAKKVTAAEVREEVEATRGPAKVSVEDRVATQLLARMKPEVREEVLANMPEKDRNMVLDTAQRVTDEKARVKADGIDLDRVLEDAGTKVPETGRAQAQYEQLRRQLQRGQLDGPKGARATVKKELADTEALLKQVRDNEADAELTSGSRQSARDLIPEVQAQRDWLQAVDSAIKPNTATAVPEVIRVAVPQELMDTTPEQLREAAKLGNIKVSEGATTRDEVLTDIVREMARRQKAGESLDPNDILAQPAKKATKKAAAAPAANGDVQSTMARLNDFDSPPSEEEAAQLLAPMKRAQLDEIAKELGIPRYRTTKIADLRKDIFQATSGRRRASIATRGFTGDRPDSPELTSVSEVLERAAKEVAAPPTVKRLTPTQVKGTSPEDLETAFNEGRVTKAPAVRHIRDVVQNLRDNAAIRGGGSNAFREEGVGAADANVAEAARINAEADRVAAIADRIEGGKAPRVAVKKAAKATAPAAPAPAAKKASPTAVKNLSDFSDTELKQITESPAFRDDQKAVVEDVIEQRIAAKKVAKKAMPAKKASTALTSNLSSFSEPELRGISRNSTLGAPQREAAIAELERRGLSVSETAPAKKAAKAAATPAAEQAVEARRVRQEVAQEVAAPVKKAAKKAAKAAPAGKHTREELMDGPLSDIVDLERELNLARPSLDRGDRVDAILEAEAAAAPVKRATKKAAKAAAPATPAPAAAPAPSGAPVVRRNVPYEASGSGVLKRVERARADEPLHLPNGGADQGFIHMDSDIGGLWQDLVMDSRVENSFVNEIARMGDDMGRGKLGLEQFLDRLKEMEKSAPDSAVASRIKQTVDNLSAPPVKLDLPDDTPPVLRKAFEDLAAIPTARKKRTEGAGRQMMAGTQVPDESVVERKQRALKQLVEGDGQVSMRDIEQELERRDFHESVDSATTMWSIMEKAMSDRTVQLWIREKLKEARARSKEG